MLGFHLAERDAGMDSSVLQAHGLGLMYCTVARSAQSSREGVIMEWIKHQTKSTIAVDCFVRAYPEFIFSLSAVRLVFHIFGCHSLGIKGTASQHFWPPRKVPPPFGSLRNHALMLTLITKCTGVMPLGGGRCFKSPTQASTRVASHFKNSVLPVPTPCNI